MQAAKTASSPTHDAEPAGSSQTDATKVGPALTAPSLNELEDVLYDLLASGGDLTVGSDKLDPIQVFLHEHARQRKSHEQFIAFFEEHGLCMRPERPNLFTLPSVDVCRHDAARTPPLLSPDPSAQTGEADAVAESISNKRRSRWSWVWAVLGFAVVGCMLVSGIVAGRELGSQLARLNAAVARSAQQIEQLRSETAQLRALVQTNAAAAQRTEHDTRLLVRTLTPPLMETSR